MAGDWTDTERLAAMYLFCQLPFGKFHARNPEIVLLARRMGRTPSSLAMKLCNFASLDPDHQRRGVRGLRGASAGDRETWRAFHADWSATAAAAADAFERFVADDEDPVPSREVLPGDRPPWAGGPTTVRRTVSVRRGHDWFSDTVHASFEGACCVSGCGVRSLLVASHIVPWAKDEANRLNPRNGLLLSSIHDRAFEDGHLAISDDFRVLISGDLHRNDNPLIQSALVGFHGSPLRMPHRFAPDPQLLRRHRESRFRG